MGKSKRTQARNMFPFKDIHEKNENINTIKMDADGDHPEGCLCSL